jgi:hypothetical protein
MPSMYVDINDSVDVDIDCEEFLNNCRSSEIEMEVIPWLKRNDYLKECELNEEIIYSPIDHEYMIMISKLNDPLVGTRLSNEELEILKQITDKI